MMYFRNPKSHLNLIPINNLIEVIVGCCLAFGHPGRPKWSSSTRTAAVSACG